MLREPRGGPPLPPLILNKKVRDGYLYLPDKPGLGWELNEAFIRDHTYPV